MTRTLDPQSLALTLLALSAPVAAQGRLVGEGQTLDTVPYGFPESTGTVAVADGLVLVGTLTAVPAGGDHAQLYGELAGAQQLYLDAALDAPADGAGRTFGAAVALGAGRVVVADPEAALGSVQGRLASWSTQALGAGERVAIAPPEADCSRFGVALDSDGARLAVLSRAQGPDAVRCFVYGPDAGGASWTLEDRIVVQELPTDLAVFGEAVALDGGRLALGAPWRDQAAGRVLVYRESPATGQWQVEAELAAPGLVAFGSAVALAGDQLLATGSESIGLGARGVVVAFRRVGGVWQEVQRLVPPNTTTWDQFGTALDLDGATAVIAAPGRTRPNGATGAVDVWTASPLTGVWARVSEVVDGSARPGDRFGLDAALDLGSTPPRVVVAATLDGRVQGRAVLLPSPLPLLLELRATSGIAICAPNGINSRGTWAKLRAQGSPIIARNDLTLEAWDLPFSTLVVFGAADQVACLSLGPIGSLVLGAGGQRARWFPQQASLSGVARLGVNLAGLPSSSGPLPVLSGSTWAFQALYRDTLGGRFTEGLRVTFE